MELKLLLLLLSVFAVTVIAILIILLYICAVNLNDITTDDWRFHKPRNRKEFKE